MADMDADAETGKDWGKIATGYARADWGRALWQLANTAIPFVLLWIATWQLSEVSWWLVPPVALLAGAFLVRLFIIQHDCGHAAWSPSQRLNNWVGRAIGMLTVTPYAYWRRVHGIHHATNGNLDRRVAGDIPTITVREYLDRSRWGRLRYRILRNPLVLFGLGAPYQFLLKYRFPYEGLPEPRWPFLRSALYTNAALVAALLLLDPVMGWTTALSVHLAIVLPALAVGVWFFYVQHNFENTYWRREPEWDHGTAALYGSSYYRLPRWANWLSGDIAVHHVHHLNARIPNYRLQEVLRDHPELEDIRPLDFRTSLGCARLHLWDEERRRMVRFDEVGQGAWASAQGEASV